MTHREAWREMGERSGVTEAQATHDFIEIVRGTKNEAEYAYAVRRVREMLDDGWRREHIITRVVREIRWRREQ